MADFPKLLAEQRAEIRRICDHLNVTTSRLAKMAGLRPSTINKIMNEKTPTSWLLGTRTMAKLRNVLDAARPLGEPLKIIRATADEMRRTQLPIIGTAKSGVDGGTLVFRALASPIGTVERPASLENIPTAYAVYMPGDAMSPRYEAGWLLFVNPAAVVPNGRDIVIRFKDGSGLVRKFIRNDGISIIAQQLNPPLEVAYPLAQVEDIHLIVGSDQQPQTA